MSGALFQNNVNINTIEALKMVKIIIKKKPGSELNERFPQERDYKGG